MPCHVLVRAWRRVPSSGPAEAARPGRTSMPAPCGAVERALPNGDYGARPSRLETVRLRYASGRGEPSWSPVAATPMDASPRRVSAPSTHPDRRQSDAVGGRSPGSRVVIRRRLPDRCPWTSGQWPIGADSPLTVAGTATACIRLGTCRFRRSLLIPRLAPGGTADNGNGDRDNAKDCQSRRGPRQGNEVRLTERPFDPSPLRG